MKIYLLIIFMMAPLQLFAQHETADVTFNDGLIFKYEPADFKMKFKFRIQGRATYIDTDSANTAQPDVYDMSVRRMRLRYEGVVFDPRFFYKIQLSFSRGDTDWDTNEYPNILRDAVVGWSFSDDVSVFIGQSKLPGNRQRVVSSGDLEFVDRSLLNQNFNIDRDMGIQLWSRFFADSRPVWVKLAISNGEGRSETNDDTGVASTARIEWLPLGAFKGENDYTEGDHEFENQPKLSFGSSYSVNQRTHRLGGQTGEITLNDETRDMKTFFADALFKYQGWAVTSEFAQRKADDPFVNATQSILVGHAVSLQGSYIFKNSYSPALRVAKTWPDEQMYSRHDITTQYTMGLSKYFKKHFAKLQGDLTYEQLDNPQTFKDQQNWIARLQLQLSI